MNNMRAAAPVVLALTLVAGCDVASGPSLDRAGGAGADHTTVLVMAQPNSTRTAELDRWADEVGRRSGGSLKIKFRDGWRLGEVNYESGTINDVAEGKVDLAWVGARAFDKVGVTSFQPLIAPLLIDSQDLQAEVFHAGIPDRMLDDLTDIELVGIGVLPGPMRKMLGVKGPLTTSTDFTGKVVGIQASEIAERTMSALGAKAKAISSEGGLEGLDGIEQQLISIQANQYAADGGTVTGNLNLWPRPLVLFAREDALTEEQLDVLRTSLTRVVPQVLTDRRAEDELAGTQLCETGATFVSASEQDLAALRRAVQPVYEELTRDPATRASLEEITRLKNDLQAPPDNMQCSPKDTRSNTPTAAGFPEGTFTSPWDSDQIQAACGGYQGSGPGTARMTFANGTVKIVSFTAKRDNQLVGTFETFRDQLTITDHVGPVTMHWAFDGQRLELSDVSDPCLEAGLAGRPWTLE